MKRVKQLFFENEASGGILLLVAALLAFMASNSGISSTYFSLLHYEIFGWSIQHIVNDGLMAIFFYVVGLEIKEEVFRGELSDPRKSSFAIFGAIGGMLFPALIYLFVTSGSSVEQAGWAIPMATDIAFAVGVLALLGKRVPVELKIFLLALAIVDDLGAIVVIAAFFTKGLQLAYLSYALVALIAIYLFNRFKPLNKYFNVAVGIACWYFVFKSGIHATVAGVLLAFLTPFEVHKGGVTYTPLKTWLKTLHPYIAFLIMPIFAFFNAGLSLKGIEISEVVTSKVSLGVVLGLVFGKPLGITLVCYIATKLGVASLPTGVAWKEIIGVGFVAGIGFTMALFINGLSFPGSPHESFAKLGILFASIVAAGAGYTILSFILLRKKSR